jgi:hypothetical protein
MRSFIAFLALLFPVGLFAGIEMEAYVGRVFDRDGIRHVPIRVVIRNTGDQDIVLPTSNMGPLWTLEKERVTVAFSPHIAERKGVPLVYSPARFMPVTLRPGEATEITDQGEVLIEQDLRRVRITYRVTAAVAKRYGFTETRAEALAGQ